MLITYYFLCQYLYVLPTVRVMIIRKKKKTKAS